MRSPRAFRSTRESPRLARVDAGAGRVEWWTETAAEEPPVYGERWAYVGGRAYRAFEPARSKLAAALAKGWAGPRPREGERWLYLGAASGTTASHVADLVGPSGRLFAVERSLRPFGRLLALAERWPSLEPILADARDTRAYAGLVPPVDGIYADIAQADQVEIVRANAALFLRGAGGALLIALKTASMGRDASAPEHVRRAERELERDVDLAPSVRLDPFHKGHYFVGGTVAPSLFRDPSPAAAVTPRSGRPPGRSRP